MITSKKFTDMVEQLLPYQSHPDTLSYTQRFVDGLRDDIKAVVVLVARPQNLDTACTLALLQEEAADQGVRKEYKRAEGSVFARNAAIKGTLPLPPPSPRLPPDDQHNARRPVEERHVAAKTVMVDDKLATLHSYRKARGLCVRCGEN